MAGAAGRGQGRGRGRRGCDRAGHAAHSPSPPSSSSSEEECRHVKHFEFILHITADPLSRKKLPDKFAQFLDGWEPAEVYLREESCGVCWWTVEIWFDGEGKMFLQNGWEEFAREHNVEVGCLVHFLLGRWLEHDRQGLRWWVLPCALPRRRLRRRQRLV